MTWLLKPSSKRPLLGILEDKKMLLNLNKPRKEYFDNPDVRDIIEPFFGEKPLIRVEDLPQLLPEKRVILGTKEGNLEQLLTKEEYTVDSLALVEKIEQLQKDQLLVLPEEYRIPELQTRDVLVYDTDTLVKLDSMDVKRKLLGEIVPKSRLSAKRKQQEEWSPEKVLSAAFNLLHQQKEELAEKTFSAYSWYGKDGHRRIVSLYRAIQGAEMRAFQNFVYYKKNLETLREEVEKGKSADKIDLTPEERQVKSERLSRYQSYVQRIRPEGQRLEEYLRLMRCYEEDTITVECSSGTRASLPDEIKYQSGLRNVRVFSRSQFQRRGYNVKFTGLPLVKENHPFAYSEVWEMRGHCYCEDKNYRSDRRRTDGKGNDEDFFCPHEVAAFHVLKKYYEDEEKGKVLPFSPFVIPTAKTMSYLEKLRQQTIILTQETEKGQFSKHSLNHTEMDNLLWKLVMVKGYEDCFTTDIQKFKSAGYDPHLDLIRFV